MPLADRGDCTPYHAGLAWCAARGWKDVALLDALSRYVCTWLTSSTSQPWAPYVPALQTLQPRRLSFIWAARALEEAAGSLAHWKWPIRAAPPSTSVQLRKHPEECSGGDFVPGTGQGWAMGATGGERDPAWPCGAPVASSLVHLPFMPRKLEVP